MIGFLLRKTLYDFWDNMFRMTIVNMGFLLFAAVPVFLPDLAVRIMEFMGTESFALEIALTGIGILLCSVYLSVASYTISSVSDFGNFGFADFFRNIKKAWLPGLVIGLFVFLLFIIATVNIQFYAFNVGSTLGIALAAIVLWVTIFALISFQFYFSVFTRLGGKIGKSFKKCMLISLDNTGFAIFIFIHNLIVILLPVFFPVLIFFYLFPGPAGILLYIDEALRLRLYKYDWLEANPGANRKKVPWEELIVEEREKVGHRTLRNFIFPWKD